ncbi:COG3014 family protein [Fluviispira multicolorata]|uniref:Uncharacterized protein n=1 Tax=Fluviispira multicolorata TaxID=2654512 RepID=A0A833N4G3_9BACT|nr:hypothetical protein [Fluviispira multicolorata]KAB8027780.1 hypothetical protein GCL57_14330 [Fluviispira multicolorata]
MKSKTFLFFPIFALLLNSCQSYTDSNAVVRKEMYAGKYKEATVLIDKSGIATENRNYALYRMEKGMLLYLQGEYPTAITNWTQADRKIDDLYTTSISKTAASFIVNDSMSDYSGEAHEKVLLPIFSSLAYFANNDQNNSLVMIRRAYDIKKYLNSENEGKNSFKYDAFSHYFSAMVYESKAEWDNAIVEYRTALKNIQSEENQSSKEKLKNAEIQILKEIGRLAEFRKRNDLLSELKKANPQLKWNKHTDVLAKGEIYIVYESGKSPIKVPKDFFIPTGGSIARVSFPEYKVMSYKSHYADIYIDDKNLGRTIVMEDIGKMGEQALNDRRLRDIVKMAARVITKEIAAKKLRDENPLAGLAANAFNIATEVADTRGWTALPDTIQIFRVSVKPNKETNIIIRPESSNQLTFTVNLKPNEKKLIRFRTFD